MGREVCEFAPVQVNSNPVEAAYRRSYVSDRRRTLMRQWGEYVTASV